MQFLLKYLLVGLMIAPIGVFAHGPVTTQTKDSGKYTVEFEYNTLGSVFAGDYTIFDTYLLLLGQPVDYDTAFIRLEKQNGPAVMAGSLAQSSDIPGFASMSGVINDAGVYTAQISFYATGKKIADGQFDFEVKAPNTLPGSKPVSTELLLQTGLVLMGLAVGAGITLWLKRSKRI